MDNGEILSLVTGLNREAAGADDEVSQMQEKALNYYFQRKRGDEEPGRSQYVSGDVSSMVEANLAAMMESFTGDNIAEFDAFGPEDEDQAQLESDAVSYYVMDVNNGYWIFQEGIKDALLLRNGLVKVYPEERETTRTRTYENVTDASYAGLVSKSGISVIKWDPEAGELKLRETRKAMTIRLEGSPAENFRYTKNWTSIELQRIPYCAERHCDIRSELVQRFPEKKAEIEQLPSLPSKDDRASNARNPAKQNNTRLGAHHDSSLDEIEWWEGYALFDADGDGIAERHRVSFVEDALILEDEETDLVCFGAGTAIINPHRFLGISLFDKLKQTQDLKTGFRRAGHDNANVANKSRTAYLEGKVDDDDIENGLIDGNIRVRGNDVRTAIMAFQHPDIGASIRGHIQDLNQERAEMGGAALDMSNANVQLSDRAGSQGIDRAYSVMEQLAALMTRNVAQSLIRSTYLLVHETLRTYIAEPIPIKVNGRWSEVNPRDWPERKMITVKIGMSPGERQRRSTALQFIINSQLQLADQYNDILVNIEGFYQALTDWSRVNDVPNPEQYFVDPSTDASKAALKMAQDSRQRDKQAQQKLTDVALGLEQLRVALDSKYNPEQERQLKRDIEQLRAEVAEMKVVGKATADLELARENGKADKQTETPKGS